MKQILLISIVQLCVCTVNAQGAWTQKANFGGDACRYAVGFSIAGKGYVGAGEVSGTPRNDFWEYDPGNNTWMQKADFAGNARRNATGFSVAGKGYIGTGIRDVEPEDFDDPLQIYENDFWEYNPTGNSWTKKANLPADGRWGATGFSIGSKGYLGIGNGLVPSNDFWEYDPLTDRWTRKAGFPGGVRYSATAFSIGSKGYIGTGQPGGSTTLSNDFYEYNPATDTWTRKADFGGGARGFAVGFSIGDKGYMGTGFNSSGSFNDFWEYDPATDGWAQKADFAGAVRFCATGFSIGNKGYVGIGSNGTKDFWEYSLISQITTNAITGSPFCAGANMSVSFTTNGTANAGNIFTAQLSDAAGSFTNPVNIGTLNAETSGSINGIIPSNTISGSEYRVRVISSDPAITGTNNGTDIIINALTTYYHDADRDGYGDPNAPTQLCSVQESYVLDNTDCDDTKGAINPATGWYRDADNDGYSNGTAKTQCIRPTDYKLESELTAISGDCDDENASLNPATVWYKDADNDGYSNAATLTQCTRPTGYKPTSELTAISGDCDDTNASLNPLTVWYQDSDNDGYSNSTTKTQCTRPTGYKLASELTATSNDCDDENEALSPATIWYKDADNDGYSNGATLTQCTRPSSYKLSTELTATVGDCNDSDASINPKALWVLDNDKDGYYFGSPAMQCSSPGTGYVLKTTQQSGDCGDNNAGINPGAVEVCGNGIDDNCNGKVDEAGCALCTNATGLNTSFITTQGATLNWIALASPVEWQVEYKKISTGSKWTTVTLPGYLRSINISALLANQKYQWHISAKCGKKWTSFSNTIEFKTLATANNTLARSGDVEAIYLNGVEEKLSALKLYPNPSKGQFMVDLQIADKINATAKFQLIDITGRTVYIENAPINNGVLQKKISISSLLSSGIYSLKVTVNDKSYFSKLIHEK